MDAAAVDQRYWRTGRCRRTCRAEVTGARYRRRRVGARSRDACVRSMTTRAPFAREGENRLQSEVLEDYVQNMEVRREMFGAAIRLAMVLSAVAAAVVLGLDAAGAASRPVLVLAVIVVGFGVSWVQSGRFPRAVVPVQRCHRITTVPVRHRVH